MLIRSIQEEKTGLSWSRSGQELRELWSPKELLEAVKEEEEEQFPYTSTHT